MWTLGCRVLVICMLLQVSDCSPACLIKGPVASCASRNLRSVPPLPSHITHLYLEMNHIGELNSTSLAGLEQLQVLDLGQQYVPLVIHNNAFKRQTHLKRLILSFNVGLQLEPKAFVGLSSLQDLQLDLCSLQDTILKENYLEPLASLETLDLFGNNITRLQPSMFFANMTKLTFLNLKLNKIDKICESDLIGFQGKHFKFLNLHSANLKSMSREGFDWQKCGNPLRGVSIHTLDLSSNGFTVHTFKQFFKAIAGTKISHLKLSGHIGRGFSFSNLPDPDPSMFEGLMNSSLHTLDLSENRIFALQQGLFSLLKEVIIIDLSQNKVNQIHRNAFEGVQGHLRMLNLSHNLLGELYSYTFASLTNLRVLDLSYNHIGALGFRSFSHLPNLKALYLTGNVLRDLGFPAPLPSLHSLLLNDNKLKPSSVIGVTRFARNIMHLNIQGNRLTNLEDVYTFVVHLKRLQHLFYGGNTIRWCTLSSSVSVIGLNKLQVLDLHGSSLHTVWSQGRCLNMFDNLQNLTGINLSMNLLQSLPQGIFRGLTSVVEMDLSFNALTYLQPDVLPTSLKRLDLSNNFIASPDPTAFQYLRFLDLSENRFHCDANLTNFLTWLRKTNVTFGSPVDQLKCEFPSNFYHVPLLIYSAQVKLQ